MPAGVQIFNDSGIVQIDEATLNFVLRQKGTVTCSTLRNTGGINYYETTIVFSNGFAPLLALAATGNVAYSQLSVSGSTWTWTILSLTNGASVNYWIFDKENSSPSYSAGDPIFEVWTAAGELAYWLNSKPLRIVGAGAGTYASGRVYATIQTANGWGFVETNPGGTTYRYRGFYGGSRVNANVVALASPIGLIFEDYTIPGYGSFTPQSYTPPAYQFLVVDVTNF